MKRSAIVLCLLLAVALAACAVKEPKPDWSEARPDGGAEAPIP